MPSKSFLEQFQSDQPLAVDELAFLEAFPELRDKLAQAGAVVERSLDDQCLRMADEGGQADALVDALLAQTEGLEEEVQEERPSIAVGAAQMGLRLHLGMSSDSARIPSLLNTLAGRLQAANRLELALASYEEACEFGEKVLGKDNRDYASFLSNRAECLWLLKHLDDSVRFCQRALAIREKVLGPEHLDVATSLNNLAWLFHEQGRLAEAEPLCRRALAIQEELLGAEHLGIVTSLDELAVLYRELNCYEAAESLYQRALNIREKTQGPEHLDVATSLDNLALLYRELGHYEDAGPLYQRALTIREKAQGPEHLDVAISLYNLAWLFYERGRLAEAEPLCRRALAIREEQLGAEHLDVATSLYNLAWLYRELDRYEDAEPLYQRALTIREKAQGPEHLDVATSLYNLARLFHEQGRLADAEPLCRRALAIQEEQLGAEHLVVATSLDELALLYRELGHYEDAEPLYQRALTIRENAQGPKHLDVATSLDNLARLFYERGRLAEAEPLCRRALVIQKEKLGPENLDVATSHSVLGSLFSVQGRYKEAEPHLKRALAIRKKTLSPNHPDVAESLINLAMAYENQERLKEAEQLYRRSLAIQEKALGPDHQNVATILDRLGSVYHYQGRYDETVRLTERALVIQEKVLGSDHPDVAERLNALGNIFFIQGRVDEVERLYQRALAIREKVLGSDNPDIASSLIALARIYANQGRNENAYQPLIQRSIDILKEGVGQPGHLDVTNALYDLGAFLHSLNRIKEAEALYQYVLSIREKALGPEHPHVAATLDTLASIYQDQGRFEEAEPLLHRVLGICEKELRLGNADFASSLSDSTAVYKDQGRMGEAGPLLQRAQPTKEKAPGEAKRSAIGYGSSALANIYASSLVKLALPYVKQGWFEEAERVCQRALAIAREGERIGFVHCLIELATVYNGQGRLEEAQPLYQRALTILEKTFKPEHPAIAYTLRSLAIIYHHKGCYEQAERVCQRALAILRKTWPRSIPIAETLNSIAAIYRSQGRLEAASATLFESAGVYVDTPLRGFDWIRGVVCLGRELADEIESTRRPRSEWLSLFDRLSELQVEALELQPYSNLDAAYGYTVDFHAVYLELCSHHGLEEQIPTILGRIKGRRLAALMWEHLVRNPPKGLSEDDKAYLKVRHDWAARALDAQAIVSGKGGPPERGESLQRPMAIGSSVESAREQFEKALQDAHRYNEEFHRLSQKVSRHLQPLANPGSFGISDLRAMLLPGQAALLLVDLNTYITTWQPFALLVCREDGPLPHTVALPRLRGLVWLFAMNARVGGRGMERSGDGDLLPESPVRNATGETDGRTCAEMEALVSDINRRWLEDLQALAKLATDESALDAEAFRQLDEVVSDVIEFLRHTKTAMSKQAGLDNDVERLIKRFRDAMVYFREDLAVSPETSERLMRRHLWEPLETGFGKHMNGIRQLVLVTHGRLHDLPFDCGRPPDLPICEHWPGMLFLREPTPPPVVPAIPTGPVLLHAYDAADSEDPNKAIPFIHSSQAIDNWFLCQFVGTPPRVLSQALDDAAEIPRHYLQASFSGHGSLGGALPLRAPSDATPEEKTSIRWDDWIARNLHVGEAAVWTCFLGRVDEDRGEPLGWPAALRLTGTTAMVGAVRSISDFWTPLLQILYRQAQFLARAPKRAPQEALAEAKRRLLSGQWYTPDELAPAYRSETTNALICRFYRVGMMEALALILNRGCSDTRLHHLLADWPLPDHWRVRLPPLGERSQAAWQKKTAFFDALRADAGEALIRETLASLTDPTQLVARPEVQSALQRLAAAFVCFGRAGTSSQPESTAAT